MTLYIKKIGEGKPLVLFHGWGFDHSIWNQLSENIKDNYELYLVDLPGFGASNLSSWHEFKKKLLLQLPSQFALAGWSMGGLFASRLAIEEPNKICQLINIASSPRFIKEIHWPGINKSVFDRFLINLAQDPQETISQFVGLQLKNLSYQYKAKLPSIVSLQNGLEILAQWDLRNKLSDFDRPTCFIFGHLDAITSRATMVAMQEIYPNFTYLMFKESAHIPFLSEQARFIDVLESLLN